VIEAKSVAEEHPTGDPSDHLEKHRPNGHPKLHDGAPTCLLQISVSDTGIGIPEEKRSAVFDPFTQADGSTTRKYGGTGLGLAISSQLVEMMGGKIWVESTLGSGSTFHFTVRLGLEPARFKSEQTASTRQAQALLNRNPLRVLLAEDNVVSQKLMVRLLEKRGHLPIVAANGREALALISQLDFDLVLMDLQMPDIDGLETMAVIREKEKQSGAHLPIIALTAHAMKGDRERCLEAGFDGYVSKPIDASELIQEIRRVLPVLEGIESNSVEPVDSGPQDTQENYSQGECYLPPTLSGEIPKAGIPIPATES
jgi:CheY-like chemotaxis protein